MVEFGAGGFGEEAGAVVGDAVDGFEEVGREGDVDAHGGAADRGVDEDGDGVAVVGVGHDVFEAGGGGDGFAVLDHAFDVELDGLGGHAAGVIERGAGGDAAGEIGEIDAVVSVGLFAEKGDVGGHDALLRDIPACFSMLRRVPGGCRGSGRAGGFIYTLLVRAMLKV